MVNRFKNIIYLNLIILMFFYAQDSFAKRKTRFHRSAFTRDETEMKADRRRLLLSTGETKAIDLDFEIGSAVGSATGSGGISIGNTQIITYDLVKIGDKRQIVFKPLKSGETTVSVRDTDGNIKLIFKVIITASNILRRAGEIRELLKNIEGIDVKIIGQKIIIDGEVLVPADYGRLMSVITDKVYSDSILNLTTLSPLAMQAIAKKIQEDINTFAPNVRTRVVNGSVLLEGRVDNDSQNVRAREIAKIYLPEVRPVHPLVARDQANTQVLPRALVQNFIQINPPPPKKSEKMVRVTVHFVELSKDFNRVFAFKWNPGYTDTTTVSVAKNTEGAIGVNGTSFTATIGSLFPVLKSAEDAGYAKILKKGDLVIRSGQPGTLNQTREIAFVQIGPNGQPVPASKTVGFKIAVTPSVLDPSDDIQLDLNINQITELEKAPVGGAPTVENHEIQTKVYIKSGESAAVAGASNDSVGTDYNKTDPKPGAFGAETVPLFNLRRSKEYKKKKSQFVIFVTPIIVENASDGTEDLRKNFRIKVK
ncbi:MAG: BON domain-containing protein [Deltaproteobacteria bacterium]|nr:BON domain-containing protein [Deltaproteobacteria bacterium]